MMRFSVISFWFLLLCLGVLAIQAYNKVAREVIVSKLPLLGSAPCQVALIPDNKNAFKVPYQDNTIYDGMHGDKDANNETEHLHIADVNKDSKMPPVQDISPIQKEVLVKEEQKSNPGIKEAERAVVPIEHKKEPSANKNANKSDIDKDGANNANKSDAAAKKQQKAPESQLSQPKVTVDNTTVMPEEEPDEGMVQPVLIDENPGEIIAEDRDDVSIFNSAAKEKHLANRNDQKKVANNSNANVGNSESIFDTIEN